MRQAAKQRLVKVRLLQPPRLFRRSGTESYRLWRQKLRRNIQRHVLEYRRLQVSPQLLKLESSYNTSKLQWHTAYQRQRNKLRLRLRNTIQRLASSQRPSLQRLHTSYQRARATYKQRLSSPLYQKFKTAYNKRKASYSSLYEQLRTAYQRKTILVPIEEHTNDAWFDPHGRPLTSRDATGRFVNPWQSESTNGVLSLRTLLEWRWERFWNLQSGYDSDSIPAPLHNEIQYTRYNPQAPLSDTRVRSTWIGHSTCLLQTKNLSILTDPIFSQRVAPYPYMGVLRERPLQVHLEDLPVSIDICLVSHDHYDHLDQATTKALGSLVQLWIVPKGTAAWMHRYCEIPYHRMVEMEWWETLRLEQVQQKWQVMEHTALQDHADCHPVLKDETSDSLYITSCPAQHWAGRTLWDRNYRLWTSFACFLPLANQHPHFGVYHAGDTALPTHFPLVQQIADYWQHRPMDLCLLPIGAYSPTELCADVHMNPQEALVFHRSLQSRCTLGVHWGSFPLAEEPLDEPAAWLARLNEPEFVTIPNGCSIELESVEPDTVDHGVAV